MLHIVRCFGELGQQRLGFKLLQRVGSRTELGQIAAPLRASQ
jgi:hypothetical protein